MFVDKPSAGLLTFRDVRIDIVRPGDRSDRVPEGSLRQAHAMRHRTFVEKRGWECFRRSDGLDIDAHDGVATHLLAFDQGGLFGYVRLLPGGYLVAARADPVLAERAIHGAAVCGLSRFCIERGARTREQCDAAMVGLMRAVAACARDTGIDVLMFDTDPSLIFLLRVAGFGIESIGPAVEFYGRPMVPVVLYIDQAVFREIAAKWAAWHDAPVIADGIRRMLRM